MKRSGNCQRCGTERYSLIRDHIVPQYAGGSDDESNTQYLCNNCHEDKTKEDFRNYPINQYVKYKSGRPLGSPNRPKAKVRKPTRCATCDLERTDLHRDHIIPKWKGGKEEICNIQYLCGNCHFDKTRTDMIGFKLDPEAVRKLLEHRRPTAGEARVRWLEGSSKGGKYERTEEIRERNRQSALIREARKRGEIP